MTVAQFLQFLTDQPLLALAMVAIFLTVLGGMLRRPLPAIGSLLRGVGNLGLVGALLLTIAQVARLSTGTDLALPQIGMPAQSVAGGETRIPLSQDGHFWIRATINGEPRRFLVDTGATLTAISPGTAEAAQVEQSAMSRSVMLNTANGSTVARLVTIGELRFGNVVARDLDAVVAPGIGETNVIGMNLLSRLASWRVEGRTMILVPNHPQKSAA